jgi:hypothetical protein
MRPRWGSTPRQTDWLTVSRNLTLLCSATKSVLCGSLWRNESAGREPPFRVDVSAEAEEFPLLEAVTKERLVKTQKIGKGLEAWLRIVEIGGDAVVTSTYELRIKKWSINPISNMSSFPSLRMVLWYIITFVAKENPDGMQQFRLFENNSK